MPIFSAPPPALALRRVPRVMLGLVLFGVGIALMIRGNYGLGPWDVLHQGLSEKTDVAIGTVIILVGFVVVVGMLALKEPIGIGTVLNTFVIGLSVDATLAVLGEPNVVGLRLFLTFVGPVVVAIGSGFYIGGALGPGPRDGLMTGLERRGIPISRARTAVEVVALALGVMLGGSIGIGTIWFAVGIGPMVALALRWIPDLRDPQPQTAVRRAG